MDSTRMLKTLWLWTAPDSRERSLLRYITTVRQRLYCAVDPFKLNSKFTGVRHFQ